jgi:hypothetical protein
MTYRGLTKFIMAKHGESTTFIQITTASCLHLPTIRTIALLIENGLQIRSFNTTFHTTSTLKEKKWKERKYKLTISQYRNVQKLLHKLYILNKYTFNNHIMPNRTILMKPKNFKKQYNSCSKTIKSILYHYQSMLYQYNN